MDTIEESKSSENNQKLKDSSSKLMNLFKKYKIDLFYHRDYKNTKRQETLAAIFLVLVFSIVLAILFGTFFII